MRELLRYQGVPVWRNVVVLRYAVQTISAVAVLTAIFFFFFNLSNEIDQRDIPFGFSFLDRATGIPIGETVISHGPEDSYLYTLLVAGLNTVKVALLGVFFATILGISVGVSRLSSNWLVNRTALVYIEVFRNIPLLVQLLFWFFIVLSLPPIREGYVIGNAFYLNNSGFAMPWLSPQSGFWPWAIVTALGITAAGFVGRSYMRREIETARKSHPFIAAAAIAIAVCAIAALVFTPLDPNLPEPAGSFGRLVGGAKISGSFLALLTGLVIYTSAFIAEIIRAGIQSVGKGQPEAARSIGLSGSGALRYVIFPQALRVVVPPTISHYLNLTKNSSLAAAIGYPDLVGVATTLTQTAPAVSLLIIVMLAYLTMSLTYALIGNIYDRAIRFRGT